MSTKEEKFMERMMEKMAPFIGKAIETIVDKKLQGSEVQESLQNLSDQDITKLEDSIRAKTIYVIEKWMDDDYGNKRPDQFGSFVYKPWPDAKSHFENPQAAIMYLEKETGVKEHQIGPGKQYNIATKKLYIS